MRVEVNSGTIRLVGLQRIVNGQMIWVPNGTLVDVLRVDPTVCRVLLNGEQYLAVRSNIPSLEG